MHMADPQRPIWSLEHCQECFLSAEPEVTLILLSMGLLFGHRNEFPLGAYYSQVKNKQTNKHCIILKVLQSCQHRACDRNGWGLIGQHRTEQNP